MEIAELFNQLESNQPQVVEEIKKTFHEVLNSTKESWLVSGLFDYYLATSSMRPVDILVGVREPHDKHLFDKISESLKGPSKLQALTFLGHIVRRHPTWIYKITTHALMKELLKLLKTESEILCLMSALLVVIVLLPMIPTLIGPFLQDIFDIFCRLAAWNTNNPTKLPDEHLLHLQVSLYALFHRLYGMYPCNFLSFLRQEYGQRENLVIFSHTIKPMLETVRMHPLLVTASKDAETSTTRWKKMEDHDVIVECAKFALDSNEKSHDDANYQGISSLRSRGGLEHSSGFENMLLQSGKSSAFTSIPFPGEPDFWSPGRHSGFSTPPLQESAPTSIPQSSNSQNYIVSSSIPLQEGTSPPEAAIEATPETTPVREVRHAPARPLPINSTAVRALNSFGGPKWQGSITSGSSTPSHSQPSSPMKKDITPFPFPTDGSSSAFEQPRRDSATDIRRDSLTAQKLQTLQRERMQVTTELQTGLFPKAPAQPTSPLRIIPHDASVPNSPVPSETVSWLQQEKNGFRFESSTDSSGAHADSTQEDQEVLRIVHEGEQLKEDSVPKQVVTISQRPCDSVLQEVHPAHVEEYEECQQESGSPCTSGGLHMPNSRSLLDFARRVHQQHRQRFYSQCVPEEKPVGLSTGSSPGEGSGFHLQERVRRANSCPEMKKGSGLPSMDPNISRTLDESEELLEDLEGVEGHSMNSEGMVNGQFLSENESPEYVINMKRKRLISAGTQTVDLVPLPYEHLFVGVFSPVEPNGVAKSSNNTSPAPLYNQSEPPLPIKQSPYQMLDKYIETLVQGQAKDEKEVKKPKYMSPETELKILKEQVILLNIQLHFERQRREVHAERNRRLLRKSITNRALEEYNSALREQVNLLQKAIEQSTDELEKFKKDAITKEEQLQEAVNYWQEMCVERENELKSVKTDYQLRQQELQLEKEKTMAVLKDLQQTEALLFDMGNEMKQAVAQASIGEQLKENLEQLQKRLLLMGELQKKYRDRFSQLPMISHYEDEVTLLQDSYHEEVKGLQEMSESRSSSLESVKARVAELESVVTRKDALIADQKKVLKQLEEEYHVQLEAVENKYKAQRAINSKMEEHMLELYRQLDNVEDSKRKATRSPDSSSIRSFSPHNSPLSQSLGSPGGLSVSGLLGRDTLEMKNLQVIVDQPEHSSSETVATSQQPTGTDHPTIAGEEG